MSILLLKSLNITLTDGIPRLKWFGTEGDNNILVIELLGPSLEDLFNFCGKKFSLKTVILLAEQMIGRLETLHSRSYIHRDLKPDNFLMGKSNQKVLFIYLLLCSGASEMTFYSMHSGHLLSDRFRFGEEVRREKEQGSPSYTIH